MLKILLVNLILFSNLIFSQFSFAENEKSKLDDKDLKNIAEFSERMKKGAVDSSTNTYAITPQDRQLFNKEVQGASYPGLQVPTNIHMDAANVQAKQILAKAVAPVNDLVNSESASPQEKKQPQILIFVSWSMGSSAIKQLLNDASLNQDMLLVFRGVKNVEEMGKSLKEISDMARPYNPTPRVMLNPTFFHKFQITQVPSLVIYDEVNDKLLGKVVGLSDPFWISSKIKETKVVDFGIKGPTLAISELDIIEVMKERALKIDWAKKKENANNNFWKKQEFIELPRAAKSLSRALDPSIEVTDDILDGAGGVIVKRGTVINPLDQKSFDKTILVFDPLDKAQLAFAKDRNLKLTKAGKSVILIATKFDTSKNWDSYKNITAEFNAPVFKLTPDVKSRFMLTVVPSVVTADKKSFYVEEINVTEGH